MTEQKHDDLVYNMATPRQYTEHGGWNVLCECGEPMGDTGDSEEIDRRYEAHIAKVGSE